MESLKNKKILVTGGAGFIGSHVVDALIKEKPESITVASNFFLGNRDNLKYAMKNFENVKLVYLDVADYEGVRLLFDENNFDVVFNLAVVPLPTSLVRPRWTYLQNVKMTLNICDMARENKFKSLIQFSSSEAFGTAQYVPMDEKHPTNPETVYAASKIATDHITLSYHRTYGIDASTIRPFNTYGPRQNARKFAGIVPLMIGRVLRGEDLVIYGDGEQTRDFIYVTDTADAAIQIYKNKNTRGKIINVASGKEVSMNKIVSLIAKEMKYNKPIVYKEARPGDVRRHLASIELAKKLINFKPKVSVEEGMKKTVEWYVKNKEVFK